VATGTSGALAWDRVNKTAANLTDLPTRNFSDLQNKPTTVAGYGITDVVALDTTTGFVVGTLRVQPKGGISMGQFQ
jgi:hypothetical protein